MADIPRFIRVRDHARTAIKKVLKAIRGALPSRAQIIGAVEGVVGDKLPQRLATAMALYQNGQAFDVEIPRTGKHVVIFVHGSSDTEAGWNGKKGIPGFGTRLENDFAVEALYLRYNSGLAIDQNGRDLADLLARFTALQKKINRLTLIGHSMGGLVIHAAVYHARARRQSWLKILQQIYLLGTPHAGAPLAKAAEKGEQILQFFPNPITLIAASVIGLRSRGLKDLSHGQGGQSATSAVLQPGVRYVFIAGGLQKKSAGILNKVLGDGMVRGASAVQGRTDAADWRAKVLRWLKTSPDVYVEVLPGVGHLALRSADAVYGVLRKYFKGARRRSRQEVS